MTTTKRVRDRCAAEEVASDGSFVARGSSTVSASSLIPFFVDSAGCMANGLAACTDNDPKNAQRDWKLR